MYLCVHTCSKGSYSPSRAIYLWEARLSSLTVFSVPVSLWNPRDGCAAVGLVAGQGSPICIHLSRSLGAVPTSMDSWPDLTCAVRGAVVPWIPSAQAAVFPWLSPRHVAASPHTAPHPTLPYPTLTGPTVPCLPAPAPCPSSLCAPDLTYLSVSLCSCRVALLHCTMQPVMAMKTSAPCSWRRELTSQLETR
jgi:hypothetical protein